MEKQILCVGKISSKKVEVIKLSVFGEVLSMSAINSQILICKK